MPGFLDRCAPSFEAEYLRYLDMDLFGKILFKNLATNVLGILEANLDIPIGKFGDGPDRSRFRGDARVRDGEGDWLTCELKCSRFNVVNRYRGGTQRAWVVSNTKLLRPDVVFDIAVIFGLRLPNLGDAGY